jgi:ribosomal protein L40E
MVYMYWSGGTVLAGMIIILYVGLTNALLGRWIAIKKGYSSTAWFWLCFFFGIFALITIAGAPAEDGTNNSSYWICKFCNTQNSSSTSYCKKCGKKIT